MTDKTISQLTAATPLRTDEIPAERSGANFKLLVGGILDLAIVGGQASLPTGLQVVDTVDITTYRTVRWAVEVRKASRYWISEVVASHDGTDATGQIPTSFQFGTGATDITIDVDISGSDMRLTATPATTGWTITWSRVYAMPA